MPRVARIGGLAAILGGTLWVAGIALYALGPSGPGTSPPYREFGLSGVVLLVAIPLLLAGVVGLWASYGAHSGGVGTRAAVLIVAGTVLFMLGLPFGQPWVLMMLGFYGVGLGSLLMGAVALQNEALPRAVAAALMGGSVMLFFFNSETAAAWLALPFGAAWVTVGFALLGKRGSATVGRPAQAG